MPEQRQDGIGEEVGGGLVSGDEQQHRQRDQLVLVQAAVVAVASRDEPVEERAAGVQAPGGDEGTACTGHLDRMTA